MSRKKSKTEEAWRWFDALSTKEAKQVLKVDIGDPTREYEHDELMWRKEGKRWRWEDAVSGKRNMKKKWKPPRKGAKYYVAQITTQSGGIVDVKILNVKLVRPAKKKDIKLPSLANELHEDLSPWIVEYAPKLEDDVDYDSDSDYEDEKKPKSKFAIVNEEDLIHDKKTALLVAGRACLDFSVVLTRKASRCFSLSTNLD